MWKKKAQLGAHLEHVVIYFMSSLFSKILARCSFHSWLLAWKSSKHYKHYNHKHYKHYYYFKDLL